MWLLIALPLVIPSQPSRGKKNNDSVSFQYNRREKISTADGNNSFSQLAEGEGSKSNKNREIFIYDRRMCISLIFSANILICLYSQSMSTDFSQNQQMFVGTWNTGRSVGGPSCYTYFYFFFSGPSTAIKKKNVQMIVITVSLSIAIMFLVGVSVFLQRFRGRCLRNQVVKNTTVHCFSQISQKWQN